MERGSVITEFTILAVGLGAVIISVLATPNFKRLVSDERILNAMAMRAVAARGMTVYAVTDDGISQPDLSPGGLVEQSMNELRALLTSNTPQQDFYCVNLMHAYYVNPCDDSSMAVAEIDKIDVSSPGCVGFGALITTQCQAAATNMLKSNVGKCDIHVACAVNVDNGSWQLVSVNSQQVANTISPPPSGGPSWSLPPLPPVHAPSF